MEKHYTNTMKPSKNKPIVKFKPLREKRYMVTDQCMWEASKLKDYNPLDPRRAPHALTIVDIETGSIAFLKSGSIIQVVEPNP